MNTIERRINDLHELAIAAGWTHTATRLGIRYYKTTAGKKEWIDAEGTCSVGVWFLVNNRTNAATKTA